MMPLPSQRDFARMPQIELGVPVGRDVAAMASLPPIAPPRLMSLDVFRGLVILAMLIVNNLGDADTTGYFWKHADWPAMRQGQAWQAWWGYATDRPGLAEHARKLP